MSITKRGPANWAYHAPMLIFIAGLIVIYILFMQFFIQPRILSTDNARAIHGLTLLPFIIRSLNDPNVDQPYFQKLLLNNTIQLNNAKIEISIDQEPKWKPLHLKNLSFKTIQQAVHQNSQGLQLSYQLSNHQWLNYAEQKNESWFNSLTLFLFLSLNLMFIVLAYVLFSAAFISPLTEIKTSAKNLGLDINTLPNKVYGFSLFKETAAALYSMQARIRDLITYRTQLLAAISHDIRTPVTRLRLKTHFIEDQPTADSINQDLTEIEEMIAGVLNFAKQDTLTDKKNRFDIAALLSATCYEYADLGENVTYTDNDLYIPFFGSSQAIKRCFTNIIQNALKYAGSVSVTCKIKNQQVFIDFLDTGPGIPEQELSRIFLPFYRTSSHRQSHSGVGLGLSIVQEIVKSHHGDITIRNRTKQGLAVRIILPMQAPCD